MIRFALASCLVLAAGIGAASAQSRDVYTVGDIEVETSGADVIAAQQSAFSQARQEGANRMIARLTLPQDRSGVSVDAATAERLAAAVDIEEETRGGGKYVGKLAVVFNPANVRDYLTRRGIPYIDRQAPKALIITTSSGGEGYSWNAAWPEKSSGHLAPYIPSREVGRSPDSSWGSLAPDVRVNGAERAVIAQLQGAQGAFSVKLTSVTAAGAFDLGTTRSVPTMEDAVNVASDLMDERWKETAIIRSKDRTRVESTVLYTSLAEWNTMRAALARSPLVSDFNIRAVARDGAVVEFLFAGDSARLSRDLRERGVSVDQDPAGWIMTSSTTSLPSSSIQ